MEQKKKQLTKAQLESRLKKAAIHLDTTRSTISIYFSDKGLRLTVDESEGYALIATGFHTHYFQSWTTEGVSRPYLYCKRIIEIANENDCIVDGSYSYQRLMQVLKDKEDKSDYNIATYYDWYLMNIFAPLYSIGENEAQTFMVYMDYMHNIAKNAILFDEHKDGLTNKQFVSKWIEYIQEFTKEMEEREIFVPKTDEQVMQENIDALQADENEKIIQEQMQNEEFKENG